MDEELRRAQRLFQRVAGSDEAGLLSLYYLQIRDYLGGRKIPLWYGGCAHGDYIIRKSHPHIKRHRVLGTRHIDFLHYATLDTQPNDVILEECCKHSRWDDWFYLVSLWDTFIAKLPSPEPGSGLIWKEIYIPSNYGFKERLQQSFDEWKEYAIFCLVSPRFVHQSETVLTSPGLYYNWKATISLYGYSCE